MQLDAELRIEVAELLDRWPSAGLAVGVIRRGSPEWFQGHGLADVATKRDITEDTVFRIGSITKTFTAVAVMQLWEQGVVDLDAPADRYLRAYRLVPARKDFPPVTLRHLLTHTAGIGYWRRLSDLRRPGFGSGDSAEEPVPPLAEYYRLGLPVEVEPGTRWVYSNHGFATLGQIVQEATDQPIARYLRERVFRPLGMEHTDLEPPHRPDLATGYVLGKRGLEPVVDRPLPTPAAGAAYSTTKDMARFVGALLGGGANDCGAVLKPETLAQMFEPHFQTEPRVPGMGLGFWLGQEGGHRTVTHSGTLAGFLSSMVVAPDDGIGVVAFTNTGSLSGRGAAEPVSIALARRLLDLPDDPIRTDIPPHPEIWSDICGWYGMPPGAVTNLFNRLLFGAGAEVTVRNGRLMLRPLTPIPLMRKGFRLHPDDDHDPYVFRVDMERLGMGTFRVAFRPGSELGGKGRFEGLGMALEKRPNLLNPRRWAGGAVAAGSAALVFHRARRPASARRDR